MAVSPIIEKVRRLLALAKSANVNEAAAAAAAAKAQELIARHALDTAACAAWLAALPEVTP